MSGVGPTEWTVTARPRSVASTATAVAPETNVDRFAMTPPGAGSRGGRAVAAAVPHARARRRGSARLGLKPVRSGRFTRGCAEGVPDAVPFHAPPERDTRDAERGRGSLPVPAVLVEHAYDPAPLVELEAADRPLARAEHLGHGRPGGAGEDQHGLDDVLELAHVARPRVLEQRAQRRRPRHAERSAVAVVEAPDEVLDQEGHIVPPLAERRQLDGEHAEPVVEVAAKRAGLDHAGAAVRTSVRTSSIARLRPTRPESPSPRAAAA